jgi:hypothetical protein
MKSRYLAVSALGTAAVVLAAALVSRSQAEEAPAAPAGGMSLSQARRSVSMLNDLYVNAVVLTHGTYVKDSGSAAAAAVARRVFEGMAKRGWPETRWLSTTGRPFNPAHNPRDAFERDAVAALKKGRARFERIEDGQLRVATLVPMVDPSCLMCHTKESVGDPTGGLSFTVRLSGK